MGEEDIILNAILEAERLRGLSDAEKKQEGIYGSSADLRSLIRSLKAIDRSSGENVGLDSIIRRVADISRRTSKLYILTREVVSFYRKQD